MGRFRELDGWRGILAICIICVHYGAARQFVGFKSAALAVELFFLLSGFVLTHRYDAAITRGTRTTKDFVIARIRRLLPTHLIVLFCIIAFATLMGAAGHHTPWARSPSLDWTPDGIVRILWEVSLLNAIVPAPSNHWGINGVDWSISIELWVSALLLVWFGREGWLRFATAAFVAAACLAYLAWTGHYFHAGRGTLFLFIYELPLRGLSCFLIGYLCYHAATAFDGKTLLPFWLATILEVLVAAWLLILFRQRFSASVDLQALAAGCVLLVVYSYGRGAVSMFLRTPPVQWLGAISFSVYLVHQPIGHVIKSLGFELTPWLYLPLIFITATALEYGVEQLMKPKPKAQAAPARP